MLCSEFIVSYGPRMHHVMLKVYCALLAENVSCYAQCLLYPMVPECIMLCLKFIVLYWPKMYHVMLRVYCILWSQNASCYA